MAIQVYKPATSTTLKLKKKVHFHDMEKLIAQQWPKLTEVEVSNYKTDRQRFSNAVKQEYHLTQEEIDMQLDLMKRQALFAA